MDKISFNNSKLLDLYKSLTGVERNRFKLYIESPYFNSNVYAIKLNQFIAANIAANNIVEKSNTEKGKKIIGLDKKNAFKLLFGKGSYNDKKLRSAMTFLVSYLEAFISQLKYEKNKYLQKEFLLIGLSERKLDKHFTGKTNSYTKELQEINIHDSDYFYRQYVLEKEMDNFFIKKAVRQDNQSLQRKMDNLDTFYLSEKLKNLCEMINRKNIISANYNLNMLDELLGYVQKNIQFFQSVPAVYIYYNILLSLLENEVPKYFNELKVAINKYNKFFSTEEAQLMYLYAQNYCIKKINSGKLEYLQELFSIYETLLSNNLIFENDYLSQWDFKNIVSVGIKLSKYSWTKEFIEKYNHRIAPEFRKNAYEYNLSLFYFSSKDYKNALKLLQRVEFTDVFYHLGSKSILLKIYFELDEVEPFYSLVDAFKVYLVRNKKVSAIQRKMYQSLVKYTKQVFDLKLKGTSVSEAILQRAVEKIKLHIQTNRKDADFTWLLERVEELL